MPAPKTPKGGHPNPGPTPSPPRGGSGQSERVPRETILKVENQPGGAEWRQAIGKALGAPLGTVLPTMEEACEAVAALRIAAGDLPKDPQLCDEDGCLNITYRKFDFCHDHIFRSQL